MTDRAAYVRALIAARCPELTLDDITPVLDDVEVGEALLAILSALEARLEALQEAEDARQRRSA